MRKINDAAERHAFAAAGCTIEAFASRFCLSESGASEWMKRNGHKPLIVENRERECLDPPTEVHAYLALYLAIVKELSIPKALRKIAS